MRHLLTALFITGALVLPAAAENEKVVPVEKAIYHWLATWNGDPTPFVWKASADVILDKVRRCKELSKTGD